MITVFPDAEAMSRAAADLFVQTIAAAVARRGRATVALAGGSTPRRTYELLAAAPRRDQVPWGELEVFWGDERCVPPDDQRSNALMAGRALLEHVPLSPGHVHPIPCRADPVAAADDYEALLRRLLGHDPALDLILLGLGGNGHTASLFPGSPALDEKDAWVAPVPAPVPGPDRVTLTFPVLRAARRRAFLVAGHDKADALKEVLEGSPDRLPAQRAVAGDTRFLVDAAAAGRLSARTLETQP